MELGLGTAQFGLHYGLSNLSGRTPVEEIEKILRLCAKTEIRYIDTASSYGQSESILGRSIEDATNFRVVTKIPRLPADIDLGRKCDFVTGKLKQSLANLAPSKIHGILFHDADDLQGSSGEKIFEAARRLAERHDVQKLGVSIYVSDQIDALIGRIPLDIIQVPISFFDQRLVKSGHIQRLKDQGIEVHARSIFLQGLLLMEPEDTPMHFSAIRPLLSAYRAKIAEAGLSAVAAAISFAKQIAGLDVVLVGVNNSAQMTACAEAFSGQQTMDFSAFACDIPDIVDPRRWPPQLT